MMKKLIVSATKKEVQSLLQKARSQTDWLFSLSEEVDILITGIGIFRTIYHLQHHLLENTYNQIINVGIAGSFLQSIDIGKIVEVQQDTFGDFGVDDNGQFIPAWDTGLLDKSTFPFNRGWLKNSQTFDTELPQKKGITVQMASGSMSVITERKKIYLPDIETMESAAFFFIALQKQIPFASIRAISNMVEPRNTRSWNIELAISNLNRYLKEII